MRGWDRKYYEVMAYGVSTESGRDSYLLGFAFRADPKRK